jgi:hypothetical protein
VITRETVEEVLTAAAEPSPLPLSAYRLRCRDRYGLTTKLHRERAFSRWSTASTAAGLTAGPSQ